MDSLIKFERIRGVRDYNSSESRHSLIRLIDLTSENTEVSVQIQLGWYYIFISPSAGQAGRLSGMSPGEFVVQPCKMLPDLTSGKVLIFHPDFVKDTSLADSLRTFSFFADQANEILPMSPWEYQLALDYFSNIQLELIHTLDRHSKRLIVSNIELFLSYCERFFSGESSIATHHNGVLQRFDQLLRQYFSTDHSFKFGIPSVAYFADSLHLSAKYFGSLVKKATGETAQAYIRNKIIEEAVYRIIYTHHSINEIAFDLGFKYPQHFSRFFKKVLGKTPNEYREGNNIKQRK